MAGSTIPRGLGRAEPQDVLERLTLSERLLTAKELAELLAVSPKTLYSYVSRNMIPITRSKPMCASAVRTWPSGYAGEPHEHIASTLFPGNPQQPLRLLYLLRFATDPLSDCVKNIGLAEHLRPKGPGALRSRYCDLEN
jgi:predicted DNA-binding transcriptional regulator AlpA